MASPRYREITLSAILLGILIGAIMNASIAYAGLKIGFTIGGSTIAAVLGFGILRGLMKKGTILETNITQTVASAVNIPNSGIIFTVPVLFLLGYNLGFDTTAFWLLTLACTVGAVLGCVFIIPVRKQMLDIDRLRFPTGTAVATILKSPGAGPKKSLVLLLGAAVAALIFLPAGLPRISFLADLNELDALVEDEKITAKQAANTRNIVKWQKAGKIPEEVAKKGREEAEKLRTRKITSKSADHFAIAAYKVSIAQDAEAKEQAWNALNKQWARKPLPGYGDLNLRFSSPTPPQKPKSGDAAAAARYQEEKREYEQAKRDVDRNVNGKPDLALEDEKLFVGRLFGLPGYLLFAFAIAPFSFGAGYITGKPGLLVLAGGILAYHVLNPVVYQLGYMPASIDPFKAPDYAHEAFNRPMGIGMLLGGALMGVLFALPAIKAAFKSIAGAAKSGRGSDELGLRILVIGAAVGFVLLFVATYVMPESQEGIAVENARPGLLSGLPTFFKALIISIFGLAWIWFAGIIISQCTGMTDWSPISGMALITIVFIMLLAGTGNELGAVLIGATLCVAVTCASDMMQDLKTGYLVGGKPVRQQVVELATTGLGPIIAMATILLLSKTATFGSPELPAPQAKALQAVISGTQGGEMPYALYGAGALLAVGLGLGAFPGLGVLVGLSMYLPIEYILPYGVGCVANMAVVRYKGRAWSEEWGVPFCAGLIVGEAVLAIIISAIFLILQGMGL